MVVRVVTGIARTGSVRSVGAERVMKEAFAHCRGTGETRGQVATPDQGASHERRPLVTPRSGREQATLKTRVAKPMIPLPAWGTGGDPRARRPEPTRRETRKRRDQR